ncbi:SGNH/GDSL hydrolase family protein [Candidatus Poribacteria bacterium]|nr:SGNH/GDSL hydrolase family protein [Candidatus Poribacteria bacterium]
MGGFVFQDGEKVVFIGDSITDCGRRGEHAPYGNGYVKFAIDLITARYPERKITYFNEGIGGNTILDLRNRWETDVIAHNPDWVSVKVGINDLHRTLRRDETAVPPDRYERLYRECLSITREKTKAKLILIDPFYLSTDTDSGSFESQVLKLIPEYLEVVGKLAAEFEAVHVRTHEIFQRQLRYRPRDYFCPEPVHPYPSGHMVIALSLLEALGF